MKILQKRYKYDENNIIGKGGFGIVYKGYDMLNNIDVAIKIEVDKKYNKREYNVYNKITGKKYMAECLDYFENEDSSFLILNLYSINSDEILKINNKFFTIKDVLTLGIQILQQLNHLHKHKIIHRDIKPENFILDKESSKFKLIDFGLCKSYYSSDKHIKFYRSASRCGTLRYMSINSHSRYALSRRDDLISLAYSLIYLYKNKLPWQGLKKNKSNQHTIIKLSKKTYNCEDLPPVLNNFYKYVTKLQFSENPDYSFLIKEFYNYLKKNNMKYDRHWSFNKIL